MAADECTNKYNSGFSYVAISKRRFFEVPYTNQPGVFSASSSIWGTQHVKEKVQN